MNAPLRQRSRTALDRLRQELLDERTPDGYWIGELSPSALSTATAVSALAATLIHTTDPPLGRDRLVDGVTRGMESLRCQQNDDGGFGDTDRSHSNIATSYLALAASTLAGQAINRSLPSQQIDRLNQYLRRTGELDALKARYGTDKTFVVPIMTNLAIAGLVDWNTIPALPFEAAVFPQSMYRLLRMPVVSYAIPALVAIGQARHFHGRRALFPLRWARAASIGRTMKVLRRMQPQSGGYLEATPLTSFVVMSLAATGRGKHEVTRSGLQFLIDSMNDQGSWPIDTNLATWVTSLSMHALASDPDDNGSWCTPELIRWHLGCQHVQRHPFTGAEPGGWGWSDLSGAVPDSDDTPAAMLALGHAFRVRKEQQKEIGRALERGTNWLCRLQNRDGGWPTFCRGWGKLPFDRSSNDLTAHAIRAFGAVADLGLVDAGINNAQKKAKRFLHRNQQPDGSWLPLWFGNQDRADETNPVYGTSRVLLAGATFLSAEAVQRGCRYLIDVQNEDGGWGGGPSLTDWLTRADAEQSAPLPVPGRGESSKPGDEAEPTRSTIDPPTGSTSSVEETALALEALSTVCWAAGMTLKDQAGLAGDESSGGNQGGVEPENLNRDPKRGRAPEGGRAPDADLAKPTSSFSGADRAEGSLKTLENRANQGFEPDSQRLPLDDAGKEALNEAIIRGVRFLLDCLDEDRHHVAWPIGFYFAKLWYHERLYPTIFATSALGKFLRASAERWDSDWPR